MLSLYPLKFNPIFVEKVWGGDRLKTVLNKPIKSPKTGESWEISAVQDRISVVKEGYLAENNLQELIEVFMGDLVGDPVYFKYGIEFPVLIKFIDANDILSVQVHPDDMLAKHRHYAYGKNELWYVIDAEPGAEIIIGFKEDMTKEKLLQAIENKTLVNYLNFEKVKPGDVFFIPAGRVHALGKGVLVAEIQQTSDITYRLYDWDRVGLDGKPRELHIDLALDAIDYKAYPNYKTTYDAFLNDKSLIIDNQYFTINFLEFDKPKEMFYVTIDSFVIYMCIEGEFEIDYGKSEKTKVSKGETVLLPAEFSEVKLLPATKSKILEIYLKNVQISTDDIWKEQGFPGQI